MRGDGARHAQKNDLKPWLIQRWCIPPAQDAAFVAAMEDILEVYARPIDPVRPLVCCDESGKELQDEVRAPQPPKPGQPARRDSESARGGSANLFLWCAPQLGRRGLTVTARRTRIDWAQAMRRLVDDDFPEAEKIVRVLDNLNTHAIPSLFHAFAPAEAMRIRAKLELHFTPKHGSWLNLAECEFSALKRQCLERRIADAAVLQREVDAWCAARNAEPATIAWRFTAADARRKLTHLYPVPEPDKCP